MTIEEKFEVSDGTSLILSDGTELVVNGGGSEGFIFYLDESGWHRDDNRNSWRYIVAFNDLLANGWDLPTNFDAYLAKMMEQEVADKTPKYLGSVFKVPVTANEGDWFTWAGESTGSFEKGRVYKAEVTRGSISWKKLDENDTANHAEFMAALSDILLLHNAEPGYFSTIFANALIAHEVFTNRLEVVGNTAVSKAEEYADDIGETAYTNAKKDAIEAASADATSKANNALSSANNYTDGKANTAESNAVATATEQRNEMAKKLGYSSYADMVSAASAGKTIIDGGYLRTLLIKVVDLLAQNITLSQNGYIQSSNYAESDGVPTAGFKIDAANNRIKAVDGVFGGHIEATSGSFNGYLYTNGVPFIIVAMVNFRIQDMDSTTGVFTNYKTANIKSFKRREKGTYDVTFKNPIHTKIFKAMGSDNVLHNYLTLMFLGNAHDSRESFAYNCHITTNYDLISIDNIAKSNIVIDESTMTADVYGATLYIADNNHDDLVDFITLQGFFVGTEPT